MKAAPPDQFQPIGQVREGDVLHTWGLDTSTRSQHPPEILNLAHPNRISRINYEFLTMFQEVLGPVEWGRVVDALRQRDQLLGRTFEDMMSQTRMPRLLKAFQAMQSTPGSSMNGQMYAILHWLRTIVSDVAFFRLEDALVDMLARTDLADDMPVSLLEPPYPSIYVELGQRRDRPIFIFNELTGQHVLEGAYLSMGRNRQDQPALQFLLTGSPVGHSGSAGDDSTFLFTLDYSDPDYPIDKALHDELHDDVIVSVSRSGQQIPDEFTPYYKTPERERELLDAIKMIAKAVLYMTSTEARMTQQFDRARLRRELNGTANPVKRRKLAKRVHQAQDYSIVIAPPVTYTVADLPPGSEAMTDEERRSVSAHWRRGHWRNQRVGKGRTEIKRVRIPPLWIRGHNGAAVPDTYYRHYEVR